jgi:predicted nucleotidyltransferase
MSIETVYDIMILLRNEKLLEKYGLERMGIFGSFARGEYANDIDFYIDAENTKFNLRDVHSLKKDLEKLTQKNIDIMLKKYANPIVLYRAQKDMKYVTR